MSESAGWAVGFAVVIGAIGALTFLRIVASAVEATRVSLRGLEFSERQAQKMRLAAKAVPDPESVESTEVAA